MKIQWVTASELDREFGVKEPVTARWRENELIKYKEITPWTHKDKWGRSSPAKWLYDKDSFASIYKELQKRDLKERVQTIRRYGRKLAFMERDIEMGKI